MITTNSSLASSPEPEKRPDQWDLLRKRLLWIYRSTSSGGFHKLRRPGWQSAVLVLKGYLEITIDGTVTRAEAGQWLISPPRPFRIQSAPDKSSFLSIGWEAEWPNHQALFDAGLPLTLSRTAGEALETASETLYASVHGRKRNIPWDTAVQHPHESFDQLLAEEEAFAAWLRTLARTLQTQGLHTSSSPSLDPRVQELLFLLQKHPVTRALDPENTSLRVGLGWRQLKNLFFKEMETSPHEYLDKRRLKEASERLLSGRENPKTVAYALGFKQLSHFSAWFRKHQGISPRLFIREGKSGTQE